MNSRGNAVNVNIYNPDDCPLTPATRSRQGSLLIPVVYQSVSAEVQNEIDRMEAAEGRSMALASTDHEEMYQLSKQFSLTRKNGRNWQTSVGGAAKSPGIPLPSHAKGADQGHGARLNNNGAAGIDVAKEATVDDHLVPLREIEIRYGTSMVRGLTEVQVTFRRARDGRNVLSPPKTTPIWLQFTKCLFGGFGVVLWVAFVLCILAYKPLGDPPDIYNIVLAIVLLLVIFSQALFFFVQERRSSNLMASFANLLPSYCLVTRDGHAVTVEASELVVGDIVRMTAGDKVPADIRLFEVNQAKVEKANLTGESEPVPLSVSSADHNLFETRNMALFGTSVLEGTAAGIVINTADRTVMGKIARVASGTSTVATSLQKEVNYFTGLVAAMAVVVCIIVVAGYYGGVAPSHPGMLSVSTVIGNCIAVVVSLLPEGTPVALAMILTLVAKRMYMAKILVKKLTVLETLGSATLIASDKTGTLTQNRMTLSHLWIADNKLNNQAVSEEPPSTGGEEKLEKTLRGCFPANNVTKYLSEPALKYLCQIMCLCNKTIVGKEAGTESEKDRKVIGNPTEAALLNAANEYLDVNSLRQSTPIVSEIAFSSRTKYHLTVHHVRDHHAFQTSADGIRPSGNGDASPYSHIVFVKGAPEYVVGMCSKGVVNGLEVNMDPWLGGQVMRANEMMARRGERVLAFAYKKLDKDKYPEGYAFDMEDEEKWTSELCFLGLAGIVDPPREGVDNSITECHNAHVRVMMITGDQPSTAVAVARDVNIITHKNVKTMAEVEKVLPCTFIEDHDSKRGALVAKLKHILAGPPKRTFFDESIVVAGNDIGRLSGRQWDFVLQHREVVFARTTPQQKLQIVKESRKRGDVVAVTGDGVNDAPALKAADLGVAMGICGSDISKEAANMVLLDDNFVTIVKGIKEGRLLFENLKKVICYLFPNGSFSEILPVLANVFLGMPMSLSTFLMIVICVGSDMIGSLGLIHECAEANIMRRPPRDARRDRLVTLRTILFAYFFIGIMESTIAFFMYFFTMWMSGSVYPSQLVFAFDKWATPGWIPHLTPDQQTELNHKGQSAFFVSLVMTQLWNLLAVRTRYQSIFRQKFQFRLIYYMLGEVAVVLCIVYLPVVQQCMYTRPMEYYHFLLPLAMGSMILVCDEIRKLLVRKFPNGIIAKLAW